MKGGDASDNIKKNVIRLDGIIDLVFERYNDITDLKHYNDIIDEKVTQLASDRSHCRASWDMKECREKKNLYILTVIRLNYYKKDLMH